MAVQRACKTRLVLQRETCSVVARCLIGECHVEADDRDRLFNVIPKLGQSDHFQNQRTVLVDEITTTEWV